MSNYSGAKMKHEGRSGLHRRLWQSCMAILIFLPSALGGAFAQEALEGIDNGNYHYQGSFEIGYRFVNNNASPTIYDTFVNQQQGPRLLDQTLDLRSLNHQGDLFDNLFVSSFGWGGDPRKCRPVSPVQEPVVQLQRQLPPRPEFLRLQQPRQSLEPCQSLCSGQRLPARI
jgi:hypothetical protein